jgi:antitoxin PrlF
VQVRVLHLIPHDQAWFWTREWQTGEREASEDIAAGRLSEVYKDMGDMFDDMDAGH